MLPQFRRKGSGIRELLGFQGEAGGIAALSTSLTIDSQTVAPALYYRGADGLATTWPGVVGPTLTESTGAGRGLFDIATANSADRRYGGTIRLESSTNPAIGTDDIVFEAVVRMQASSGYLLSVNPGGTLTFQVRPISGTSYWRMVVHDGVTQVFLDTATGQVINAWVHLLCVIDRSGSAQWYVNGVASGSPKSVATVTGSLTPTSGFQVGHINTGGDYENGIGMWALWHAPNWLDTHLQSDIARDRYATAFGVYSTGATIDLTTTRTTAGYINKVSHVDGIQRLHYVGAGVHRYGRAYDDALRVGDGVLSEAASTNLCLQSEDLTTSWIVTRATIGANATTAPNGELTADSIDEDGTAANSHTMNQDLAVTISTDYVFSCYGKAINRQWVNISTAGGSIYFDLASGIQGTALSGATGGIEYLGNGWHRFWVTYTAAATGTDTFRLTIGEADGDATFDGLSQPSLYLWGAQVETGTVPSSYIPTTTTTVTRTADDLVYDVSAMTLSSGTLACDVLQPSANNGRYASLNDGTEDNRLWLTSAGGLNYWSGNDGGVNQFSFASTSSPNDYRWHEVRGTWIEDEFRQYFDGTEEGTADTNGTVSTSMDTLRVGREASNHTNGLVKPRIYSAPTTASVTDFGAIMANGEIYVSSSAATSLTTTPVIVAGTTTLGAAVDFDMPSNMRLRYTGTANKSFRFGCTITWTGAPNEVVNCTLYKNGSAVSKTTQRREIGTGGDVGNMSVKGAIEMAQNDYVELYAAIESGSDTGTVTQMVLICTEAN